MPFLERITPPLTHVTCTWVLLYIERWLTAPMVQEDETRIERSRGTPQGGEPNAYDEHGRSRQAYSSSATSQAWNYTTWLNIRSVQFFQIFFCTTRSTSG